MSDDGPPMVFDGRIYWYVESYDPDPAADICCVCRKLIPEDDVPLILWKTTAGGETWMARIHSPCAAPLLRRML